ncbi:MAG: UvrD-helicase domain-containing protein [Symbiobacteriaceae bacterium]|nr:UvrD-helicase domain-containing protein [Symbiobacteriaceae bacterium]
MSPRTSSKDAPARPRAGTFVERFNIAKLDFSPLAAAYHNQDSLPFQSSDLNEEQLQAVTTTEGYLRVIAGAGSGKTRALVHRYIHLVEELGISPGDILCVTFTNKAAAEMKKRVRRMVGDLDLSLICTFHSFCAYLLRQEHHRLQFPANFLILDSTDQRSLFNRVFETLNVNSKRLRISEAIAYMDVRKDNGYTAYLINPIEELLEARHKATDLKEQVTLEYIYEQRKEFALDFNDLIILALQVLETYPEVCLKWQQQLNYIMVDEFQDVNNRQHRLVSLLSDYHKNLFVVGDPDQTIYTWRGAKVELILGFDQRFPNTQTIILDKNYRSLPAITKAANALIKHNHNRIPKELVPVKEGYGKAIYFHARSIYEEAAFVAAQIEAMHQQGIGYSDIVILYRAHYVSRAIEEALLAATIPYIIYSGISFYERKEIKDVLAYLRFINNQDDLSFERIINEPKRGFGKKSLLDLRSLSQAAGATLYQTLQSQYEGKRTRRELTQFISMVERYRTEQQNLTLTDLLTRLLIESGYEELLQIQGDEERLNNLAELKQSIYDYELTAGEDVTLQDYLDHISFLTSEDRHTSPHLLRLMTVHAAKGLEFPFVFLCGFNEGIFPSRNANTPEKMEEERRLAYVAMTRAEHALLLTDAEGYHFDEGFRYPSRFLFNTGKENLEYVIELRDELVSKGNRLVQRQTELHQKEFTLGDTVFHAVFGRGEVIALNEEEHKYVIRFDSMATERGLRFGTPLRKME